MRLSAWRSAGLALTAALVPLRAWCVDLTDDRISFSGNGTSLTNTSGGGGAAVGWLHNFDPDTILGVAGEHERLGVSHWSFGSLSGAITRGAGDARLTLYGDAHEGAGKDGGKSFNYFVETLGVTGTFNHRLSTTLEDKQFNVETTHGNLPKLQAAYLWSPHLQTTLAYAYSFGGNLGTRLTTARVDSYLNLTNIFVGGAVGQASPSVLNAGFTAPSEHLKEGYLGVTRTIPQWRGDLTLIVDYQHLSGGNGQLFNPGGSTAFTIPSSQRWTGTLNYVFHIGHHGT